MLLYTYMKITTFNNLIAMFTIIGIGFFMSATMVFANTAYPVVNTTPATDVTQTSARLSGSFHANGANIISSDATTYIAYSADPNNLNQGTESAKRYKSSSVFTREVKNLEPNTTYYYEIVLIYDGEISRGGVMSFTTQSPVVETSSASSTSNSSSSTSNTTSSSSTNTNSGSNTSNASNSSNTGSSASNTSATSSNTQASSTTSPAPAIVNPVQSNNLSMILENGTDSIGRNDVIAYDLILENTQNQLITDTIVFLDMPRSMEVFRVTGAEYSTEGQTLIFDIGTVNAGQEIAIRIMAEMKRAPQEPTIIARAQSLYVYNSTAMTNAAVDIDNYNGNTASVGLAASAGQANSGGMGFFGWLVIAIVAIAVFMGVRIFRKKKQEHSDHAEFYQDTDGSIKPRTA